jgi:transposase
MKTPKEADQHKGLPSPKNYGADISTLIRMIEAGEL